jgi:glycosyltransferase involved in cell wall biosynthesis
MLNSNNSKSVNELRDTTVLQIVSSIGRDSFGEGYAATHLSAALARAGVDVYLASVNHKQDAYEACNDADFPLDRWIGAKLTFHSRIRFSSSLFRRLINFSSNRRLIIHMHGMWPYSSYVGGLLAKRMRCPLVISPHGELESYALSISHWKKSLAFQTYAHKNFLQASCFWALSNQEKNSIEAAGYRGRIVVIPNGVAPARDCSNVEIADFLASHGVSHESRILLYLSRIARLKNLPLLLRTFARAVKQHSKWILIIAGEDEAGHIHEIRKLIDDLNIGKSIRLVGGIFGKDKSCAFHSSSAFVLPSYSEGLPIAVLEAMEYGKPVLITDGWTLPVSTTEKFGWITSVNETAFEAALHAMMRSSEEELKSLGSAGQRIVREHFNWNIVAQQACAAYSSLLESRAGHVE